MGCPFGKHAHWHAMYMAEGDVYRGIAGDYEKAADRAARNIAHGLAVVGAYEAGKQTGRHLRVIEEAAMKRLEGTGG